MKTQQFDVLIIGSGMVGAALASSLGSNNFNVGLIDKQTIEQPQINSIPSLRVSAINLKSQAILEKIGAWELIPDEKKAEYNSLKVWDKLNKNNLLYNKNKLCFSSAEINQNTLGCIIENNCVRNAILQTITNKPSVTILAAAKIESLAFENTASVITSNKEKLTANLIVGADGINSFVRKKAALGMNIHEYRQHCFTAIVELYHPAGTCTWQQFSTAGTTALLPLASYDNKHYASLIWHTDPQRISLLQQASAAERYQQIKQYFPPELPAIKAILDCDSFALSKSQATRYCSKNLVLIGDAAHSTHPLAGQGANLGFQDVSCLTDVLIQANNNGHDIGNINILRKYEKERKTASNIMNSIIHSIYLSFNQNDPITKSARNLAMYAFNKIPFIKKLATNYAGGMQLPSNKILASLLNCR